MAAMQVIQPSHIARPSRGPMLMGTIVGGVLLAGGLVLGWLAFAPFAGLQPRHQPADLFRRIAGNEFVI